MRSQVIPCDSKEEAPKEADDPSEKVADDDQFAQQIQQLTQENEELKQLTKKLETEGQLTQQHYLREQERANALQTQLSDSQLRLAESEKESHEQAMSITELKT